MLHRAHLRDAIGECYQFWLRIPPGHDNIEIGPPRSQRGQYLSQRQIVVAQRDIQLIQDQQLNRGIGHQFLRLLKRPPCRCDIARLVLRFPGETFAHCVPRHLIAKSRERVLLTRLPRPFHELHHAHPPAMTERAQRQPKRCRRLAFAGAGMNQQHTLLDVLARNLGVLHRLTLLHLRLMASSIVRRQLRFTRHFTTIGSPATINTTRSAIAATL